jgi:hypothetical protein
MTAIDNAGPLTNGSDPSSDRPPEPDGRTPRPPEAPPVPTVAPGDLVEEAQPPPLNPTLPVPAPDVPPIGGEPPPNDPKWAPPNSEATAPDAGEEWGASDGIPSVEQHFGRNEGIAIGIQINQTIHRLRGDLLPTDWINRRLATYRRLPAEEQKLNDILTREHVLVLHASESTGRYTAALAALHQKVGAQIRQVRREPGDPVSVEGLEGARIGWILDLRDEGDRLPSGIIGPSLTEDAPYLQRTGSYLVVLTSTEAWQQVARGSDALAHHLQHPDPIPVLRAHLETLEVLRADRWLSEERITTGIGGRPPAEVVGWARTIHEAEALAQGTQKVFEELVDDVVQAAEDWRTRLLAWHTGHPDSSDRNYLLAAAVLDGAPVETVYKAADSLARALGETPQPRSGQQGLGVIALTEAIHADLTREDTVCFRRPGYTESVVDYFWVDRPHLTQEFTHWTAEQTRNKDLPDDVADQLAGRVSRWALDYTRRKRAKRATELLRDIAQQWAKPLPEQACDLLAAAALDPEAGRRARDAYLSWVRRSDEDVSPRLKVVLAQACERLAAVYPTMMLLRLTELAAHTEEREVTSAVGHALTALWDQPKQRQNIQNKLTEWASDSSESRRTAACHAFIHLATRTADDGCPVLLTTTRNDERHDWQAARWRDLLDSKPPYPLLQPAFNAWMDAAVARSDLREPVLSTFQDAIYRPESDLYYSSDRCVVLTHLLYAWAPPQSQHPPSVEEQLRDQLVHTLHEADLTAPMPHQHAKVG